jgi:Holliday junction resolvase RusA-like endonuclease
MNIEKEYNKLYGDIPKYNNERIEYLLKDANLKRNKLKVYDEIKRINSIKWKKKSFTLYIIPKATPRPRSGKNGIFYVKGASDNKKFFKDFIKDKELEIINTPCKIECISYLPISKSMNSVNKILAELGFIRPISKPDWDNLAKAYCDMIQGYLLTDDALIIEGISKKYYSIKPRVEITIKWMESFDCKYNEDKIINKIHK